MSAVEASLAPGTETALARPARPTAALLALRFSAVGVLVALDLWSKSAAFALLERLDANGELVPDPCVGAHARLPLRGEWFAFMPSLNPGAAFGQLHSIPWLLVGGRVVAAVFLTWLVARAAAGRRVFNAALVLVLAGALGNLYDNLLRARELVLDRFYDERTFGPVRDFIDVYFARTPHLWPWNGEPWHFPTFNVADSCITVGAILLLASGLFSNERARRSA